MGLTFSIGFAEDLIITFCFTAETRGSTGAIFDCDVTSGITAHCTESEIYIKFQLSKSNVLMPCTCRVHPHVTFKLHVQTRGV